jgi:hypothetical protein
MGRRRPIPTELGGIFTVGDALSAGVTKRRLRGDDLSRPFRGVRTRDPTMPAADDPYERQRSIRVRKAREYLPRLRPGQVFSHETAAAIWGAPLPLAFTDTGRVADESDLMLHVSTIGTGALPRVDGVIRHRATPRMTAVRAHDGLPITSAATTWASFGSLPLRDLVALGDFFCRAWRAGFGRPTPGMPPLATVDELRAALESGRRRGGVTLRHALGLVREDSWSPRESRVRLELVMAGLPEPELNVDLADDHGRFLGCVDLVYRKQRVVIEYLGMFHASSWAADVERIAAPRAAGWTVIEVTAPLLANPHELVRRVANALAVRTAF